jgi:hypothetical protein
LEIAEMAMIDIFNDDAFNTVTLTNALSKIPYKPQMLGSLGIFQPKPIRGIDIAYEKMEGTLSLIQTSQRGAPLEQRGNEKRDIRVFRTRRIAKASKLRADEILGIRAFGSESELQQAQDEVMRRMIALRDDLDLTMENQRLGAVQGIVLDANGDVLDNWFTAWDGSQPSEIDFDLDNAAPASGAVKKLCNQVIRTMARNAKGAFTPSTRVIGLCGDAFYDDLTSHKEVVQTFLNQQAANSLREDYADVFEQFRYGGITWANYRGTDDGSTVAVGADKVKFFPLGANGVFDWVQAPGESFAAAQGIGQPFYANVIPDTKRDEYVEIEVKAYPLLVCTLPQCLLRGKRT